MSDSVFNKVRGFQPATLLKRKLGHTSFPDFANFLKTSFSKKSSGQLLLDIQKLEIL